MQFTKTSWLAVAAALLLIGCSDKGPKVAEFTPSTDECVIKGETAPDWVCIEPINEFEGYYIATGSAEVSKAGYAVTRDKAQSDAVGKLSLKINQDIKTKVTDYIGTTGANESETVDKAYEKIVRQTSQTTLRDVKTMKHWQHPKDETLFLLMGVEKNKIDDQFKQSLTSLGNEEAAFQKFKSQEAERRMDEEKKEK